MIGPDLQAKVGASDLVQETFVEAQRHLAAFRGKTDAQLAPAGNGPGTPRLSEPPAAHLATKMCDPVARSRSSTAGRLVRDRQCPGQSVAVAETTRAGVELTAALG